MKLQEFKDLRLNDEVIDEKGNRTKAYDIDRNTKMVKVVKLGWGWRPYQEVGLPGEESQGR